jgi:hypothetical protein
MFGAPPKRDVAMLKRLVVPAPAVEDQASLSRH